MAQSREDDDMNTEWHLDKRVPIVFVLGFILQTVTLVYVGTTWKADIDNRIANLERSDTSKIPQESRIIILEQQYQFIESTLRRIEDKIDKSKP